MRMAMPKQIEEALRTARCYARGGGVFSGFLNSPVPGRTDKLPITVNGGAYVLPADHIAALGQGNSLAGADIVNKMFKMGPYGTALPSVKGGGGGRGRKKFAEGGVAHDPTPIIAAGGEVVVPPEAIAARFGDVDRGHQALDKWVTDTRKQHIATLRGLKPPKKD